MYFNKFSQGLYDLKGDGNDKLLTDLFTRVKARDKILDVANLFDKYDVPNGETPEITAYKHFGDTKYHWVIMLTNNVQDRYYDWPLSYQAFEEFINDKYSNPEAIHHYEITQSSGKTKGDGPDDYSHKIEVNSDTTGAVSISNREFEQREQDKKRQIKLLDPAYLQAFIEEFDRLVSE